LQNNYRDLEKICEVYEKKNKEFANKSKLNGNNNVQFEEKIINKQNLESKNSFIFFIFSCFFFKN
jgi:hypothetical protein